MNLQCIICLELYTLEDELVVTSCGHIFHMLCLRNWLQHQLNCAQCRSPCGLSNLKRVYLSSASENEVHLSKNCNVEKISEDLELTQIRLKTVQDDLQASNSTITELKTVIASLEDMKRNNIMDAVLQQRQLDEVNVKSANLKKELEESKAEIAELRNITLSVDKNSPGNNASLNKELELVKLQKQIIEDELKKSKEEIVQMKTITQALALQNLSRYTSNNDSKKELNKGNCEDMLQKNQSHQNHQNKFNKRNYSHNGKNLRTQSQNMNNTKQQGIENGKFASNMNLRAQNHNLNNANAKGIEKEKLGANRTSIIKNQPKEMENKNLSSNMTSLDEPWW